MQNFSVPRGHIHDFEVASKIVPVRNKIFRRWNDDLHIAENSFFHHVLNMRTDKKSCINFLVESKLFGNRLIRLAKDSRRKSERIAYTLQFDFCRVISGQDNLIS